MARVISEDALAVMTIAQEAIGESYEGKVAVAEVIRNRMAKHRGGDGATGVAILRLEHRCRGPD
jgi:spore germination cell wall hydrolase CwlJ-like protein